MRGFYIKEVLGEKFKCQHNTFKKMITYLNNDFNRIIESFDLNSFNKWNKIMKLYKHDYKRWNSKKLGKEIKKIRLWNSISLICVEKWVLEEQKEWGERNLWNNKVQVF